MSAGKQPAASTAIEEGAEPAERAELEGGEVDGRGHAPRESLVAAASPPPTLPGVGPAVNFEVLSTSADDADRRLPGSARARRCSGRARPGGEEQLDARRVGWPRARRRPEEKERVRLERRRRRRRRAGARRRRTHRVRAMHGAKRRRRRRLAEYGAQVPGRAGFDPYGDAVLLIFGTHGRISHEGPTAAPQRPSGRRSRRSAKGIPDPPSQDVRLRDAARNVRARGSCVNATNARRDAHHLPGRTPALAVRAPPSCFDRRHATPPAPPSTKWQCAAPPRSSTSDHLSRLVWGRVDGVQVDKCGHHLDAYACAVRRARPMGVPSEAR